MTEVIRNRNRENAVKQISKALTHIDKHDPDAAPDRLVAACANAFIYIGDQMKRIADSFDKAEGGYGTEHLTEKDINEISREEGTD